MSDPQHGHGGKTILIIGAGATGLLLAQGLKKAGIEATICERDDQDRYLNRSRDWGMTLHWGTEALDKILPPELHSRVNEACCDPHYKFQPEDADLVHYAGHTGEMIMRTPAANAMSVTRRKMRRLFSQGLDVNYGKKLARIEQDNNRVVACFEDGERLAADLIIGCDGAHSVVRKMLVGEEKAKVSQIGINFINMGVRYDVTTSKLIRAKHPIFFNSFNPRGWMYWLRIQDAPDPEDPSTWLFQNLFSWQGAPYPGDLPTQKERTAWLRCKAAEYVEPWKTVLQSLPDNMSFEFEAVNVWRPIDWSASPLAGKVTLAGDAAHSLPPFRGQGLNTGVEDAALLCEQIVKTLHSGESAQHAVQVYEEEMVPRALREVELSGKSALMLHNYDRVLSSPMAKLGIRKSREEDMKVDSVAASPIES